MKFIPSSWRDWVVSRFGLDKIRENTLDRRVPKSPWYYGDGATLLMLLGILVGTGIIMSLTYSPTPQSAYDSVNYITNEQVMGWFVRGLHYWAAGMMVVMVFLHLMRQILLGGYKSPREGTWLTGVAMLFFILTMAFIGYLLRWDMRAVNAISVVLHMFSRVPVIGDPLVVFLQGGEEIGSATLIRLYAIHVILVPLLLLGLVFYHLYLVIIHGVTSETEKEQPVKTAEEQKKVYKADAESEERGEIFYPDTAAKSGLMAGVVFLLVLGLTLLWGPPALFPEGSLTEASRPRAEWWYWWYDALIALVPHAVAPALVVVFPILLFLGLLMLPFLDRSPNRGIRKRPLTAVAVAFCVIAILVLTELRADAPWEGGPQPGPPPLPEGVEATAAVEEGRQLFWQYGCNSCHPVDGIGPRIARDLAAEERRLSLNEIREFILQPPEDVAMPSFENRLTEEELERISQFVHVLQAAPMEP